MENLHLNETGILAHWTYTRDEWKAFVRWAKKKKGPIHQFLHLFSFSQKKITPEIKISSVKVSIGDDHRHFSSDEHRFERIDIRDEGPLNVMAILYRWSKRKTSGLDEIRVPVPKGKLREAIELEEKLNAIRGGGNS